jgi:hypothetical protein
VNLVHRIISAGFATAALASAAVPALGGSGWSEADADGGVRAASAIQAGAQRPAFAAGHSAGAAAPATTDSERR